MTGLETVLAILAVGVAAFFTGSYTSPHAAAYKKEAQTWQGMYSGLKKQRQLWLPPTKKDGATKTDDIDTWIDEIFDSFSLPEMLKPLAKTFIKQKLSQLTMLSQQDDNHHNKQTKNEGGQVW